MIRVILPYHLRTLAQVGAEVQLDVDSPITQRSVLDALEARYAMLRGTIRDHVTHQRRPLLRFFACEEDLSHEPPDAVLPDAVASGAEPFFIVGAIAGGGQPWAVLWDVDGTLVDTAELHFQAWVALAREIGMPFTRADFAGTFGWRNPEIIPKLFGTHYSETDIAAIGDRKEDIYREELKKGVALLPGVRALLDAIHAVGARQAIGSSAPRRNIDLILDMTRTAPMFSAIVSMEETRRGKPHPEVFQLGAARLGVSPERCVVIEDAPVGVQAAKAGGMRAIGVTFVAHHSAETLRGAGADLVVTTLEEVEIARLSELLG